MKVYFFPFESGFIGLVLLQAVEVFEEQQLRRLLGVIEFGRASRLSPQDVVDVFEGLFKHGWLRFLTGARCPQRLDFAFFGNQTSRACAHAGQRPRKSRMPWTIKATCSRW